MREKRCRVIIQQQDIQRLSAVVAVVQPELQNYQEAIAQQLRTSQGADDAREESGMAALKLLTCLESLLPNLDDIVKRGLQEEEKQGRVRVTLNEDEPTELRVLHYCTRHLPELPQSIPWSEFSLALAPLLEAIDHSSFDTIMSRIAPKAVSCSVDDFKRGRAASADTEEEVDGFDWNV